MFFYVQSPVSPSGRSPFESDLQPFDAKVLLDNEPEPVKTVLEGVDVQRGYGMVRTEDGRQAELATVAVDAWHIKEHNEEEVPTESLGQLHEGDAYIIRWKYSITTLGESCFWQRCSLNSKWYTCETRCFNTRKKL